MAFQLRRTTFAVGIVLLVSLASVPAQGPDPLVGTWKLNVAASNYDPGPAPKSSTRIVEDWGGGVFSSTASGVSALGNPAWSSVVFRYDGKDYPYAASTNPGTSPTLTTLAYKRVDANTIEVTVKVAGKVVQTQTTSISKDGKTYTTKTKGVNTQGKPVNNVTVSDRQ
ncbi:MAG: hypothetical protein WCP29_01790 [Acidobacteriota bacterium]